MLKMILPPILLCSLISATAQAVPFSHVIIFGDSLSDSGNLPTHAIPLKKTSNGFVRSNLIANYTIAISNPVNTAGWRMNWATQVGDKQQYPWPPLLLKAPSYRESSPLAWPVKKNNRSEQSASWAVFFTQYAAINNLIPNNSIISSRYLQHIPPARGRNINYAWASALLNNGCFNFHYKQLNATCTQATVGKTIDKYHHISISKRNQIEIPSIDKQISFFLADAKAGLTTHDNKTLYILWGGGITCLKIYTN